MNDDGNHPQPQPWIDPALEARIVAEVMGESSAFESAELERAVAENPELAIFKRRIEAVHDLVGVAMKPEKTKLQLSPERREKLLATLGVSSEKPKKNPPIFTLPPPAWWSSAVLIRIAACFVIGAIFVTFFSSVLSFKSSRGPTQVFEVEFQGESGGFVSADLDQIRAASSMAVASEPTQALTRSQASNLPLPVAQPAPMNFAMNSSRMSEPSAIQSAPSSKPLKEIGTDQTEMAQLSKKKVANYQEIDAPEVARKMNGAQVSQDAENATGNDLKSPDSETNSSSSSVVRGERASAPVLFRKGGEGVIVSSAQNPPSGPAFVADDADAKPDAEKAVASRIVAFTGGWGKGSGAGTGGAKDFPPTDGQFADAKPSEHWDSLYMFRGANVLAKNESAIREQVPMMGDIPLTRRLFRDESKSTVRPNEELAANVTKHPIFVGENGEKVFDGFIEYGAPINGIAPAKVPDARQAQPLLEEAKSYSDSGRFDLAFKRYEQVLSGDPHNIDARRGMEEVSGARANYYDSARNETRSRMLWSVANEWERPVRQYNLGKSSVTMEQPNLGARSSAVINQKLDRIIIPKIDFRDVTVREAVEFLNQRANALDTAKGSEKKGVNVVLNLPTDAAESEAKITLELSEVPLRSALESVAAAAGLKVKVEPYAVAVLPLSDVSGSLVTKEYQVPPDFISDSSAADKRQVAKNFLEANNVPFPPGASATYLAGSNKLIVRNTEANLEIIKSMVDAQSSAPEPLPKSAEILTAKQPFSTFSLHVSDVSFQLAKDALAKGSVPDPARIRAEEFYNAFDYNDPAPATGEPVTARIEQSAHPFRQQRDLVRIALKVAAAGRAAGQPLRLTILLDTSGSMEREDRAATVRRALQSLATLLGPNDRVTLIGFARTPRLLAEQVPGDQASKLVKIADRTPSEGGTNLETALALASEMALKQKLPAAQNRIVLLTDGAANLGNADPTRLAKQIESTRQQGISFDACGVGADGLNDSILEALTRKGDGRYYFLNKPEDADAGFARQLAGALRPAAENVKVQVVFNPARVKQYRLIGFEKHLLKKEDFRNDKVQAAELSAEEAGVALYQVETLPEGEGDLGQVFVRFRDPATGSMVERSWPMAYEAKARAFDQASPSMQLATTAALLAEKLRGDSSVDLNALAPTINTLRRYYPNQTRVNELIQMVERLRVTKP